MSSVTPTAPDPDETPDEARKRKNRERAAAWRAANREKVRADDRARYLRNRDARLAYEATPERRAAKAARMKKWREDNPEQSRLQFRAWNYGLTVDELVALLARGCDVCGSMDRLHVDHDHTCCPTGSSPRSCGKCVRGPLCHGCNTALGLLDESEERVLALLNHLRSRSTR